MAPITQNLAVFASSLSHHLVVAALGGLALLSLFCLGQTFYNAFFHPLKHYPGPKSWGATRLPWIYHKIRGDGHKRIFDLHCRYGPVVRVGPNDISYTSDTAWKTIYGHKTGAMEMSKDTMFGFAPINGVHGIITSDRAGHARQRKTLAHAFSEQALREQEGILQEYATKLVALLNHKAAKGSIDMVRAYNFFTFDVIGDLSFGETFGCLDTDQKHPIVDILFDGIKGMIWKSCLNFYGLGRIQQFVMPKRAYIGRSQNFRQACEKVDARVARQSDHKDFIGYIISAPSGKSMSRSELHTNAMTLVGAGSETTATLLSGATYNILSRPEIYKTLVTEIRSAFQSDEDITLTSVNNLKYMLAVLDEALRFYPPVVDTLPRIVPPGGETIDGRFVPAGTIVGVHLGSAHRLPANFHRPDEFLPERWLPENRDVPPFRDDNRAAVQPFSYGPRSCLGRNLAFAEMRLILAKMLFHFDMDLEHESKGWQERQRVFLIWEKEPLMVRLTPVVRA